MRSKMMVQGAAIAAIYAVLTLLLMPISYGVMQVRVAEALCILPAFTPAAVPGLFVGCFIANVLGPNGIVDTILGSLATLMSACLTYRLRKNIAIALLPPVLINGIVIGAMLYYVYTVPLPLWSCMLWVGLGEGLACYGLGLPLYKYLGKEWLKAYAPKKSQK